MTFARLPRSFLNFFPDDEVSPLSAIELLLLSVTLVDDSFRTIDVSKVGRRVLRDSEIDLAVSLAETGEKGRSR